MSKKKETVTEHGLGIISSVIVEHVKNEYGATFLRITPVNLDTLELIGILEMAKYNTITNAQDNP